MSSDLSRDPDTFLDLEEGAEDLGEEVQKTNTELEKIKRQLEDIEKQKLRLEELKRRQDELETGRSDMLDKLTRSLVIVERESEETRARLEQLSMVHNSFTQHLRHMESINAKAWGAGELPKELSRALSSVEAARAEYVKAQPKISIEPAADASAYATYESEYGEPEERNFIYWLRSGFAFTLPIQILALIGLLIWVWTILAPTP